MVIPVRLDEISRSEALRYMGWKGECNDKIVLTQIEEAERTALISLRPAVIADRFSLDDHKRLSGTIFAPLGRAVCRLLDGAHGGEIVGIAAFRALQVHQMDVCCAAFLEIQRHGNGIIAVHGHLGIVALVKTDGLAVKQVNGGVDQHGVSSLQFSKGPQNGKAHISAFFGVELTAEDVVLCHGGGQGRAVFGGGDQAVVTLACVKRMDKVHMVALLNVCKKRGISGEFQCVPADVRYFQLFGDHIGNGTDRAGKQT